MEYTCVGCGVTRTGPPSTARRAKYCSSECWYRNSREKHLLAKPKKVRACETCGAALLLNPASTQRFCSQVCMITWRTREVAPLRRKRTARTCEFCGATFERHTCAIPYGRGKFCSRTCHGSYRARQQGKISQAETGFLDALEERGLTVFRNERIGKWCPDGIIPAYKAVVEFDGEYWHSLPGIAEKDTRKTRALQALGWRVIRVPENDYIKDPRGTIERVRLEVTTT